MSPPTERTGPHHEAGPGTTTVDTIPRWTDEDLRAMHEIGRLYERHRLAVAFVEFSDCELVDAKRTSEDHIRERIALFERLAEEGHRRRGTRPFLGRCA